MTLLRQRDLTVTEDLGEDAAGKAQTSSITVKGTFVDVTQGSRLNVIGGVPAGTVFAYIEPDGFGDTWGTDDGKHIKTISDGSRLVRVSTVVPATNPRTSELHHIEASGGL